MSQSAWISVKDRLPEPKQPFWAHWDGKNYEPITVHLNGTTNPKHYFANYTEITHWMPATLPEPPKSEAEIEFEKWAIDRSLKYDYEHLKVAFLAGWQAHEKRGEG